MYMYIINCLYIYDLKLLSHLILNRLILMHPTMDSIIPYILSMIHLALLTSFSMLHAVYLTKVVCCVSRV